MTTFADLLEHLKREDELSLLEILNLTSKELVDLLEDLIFDNQESIRAHYGEDDQTLEW